MTAACFFDVLRGAAFIVGLSAGTKNRISDLIFTTWFGLGIFLFPEKVLDYQVTGKTQTDGIMVLWMRMLGLTQLMQALYMWLTRDSKDETVKGSLYLCRIIGTITVLMVLAYGMFYKGKTFSHGSRWFIVPFFVGILLQNICDMYRSSPHIGRGDRKGIISIICRVYFLLLFLAGMYALAFPTAALKNIMDSPSFLHQHLVRVVEAAEFGMLFLFWYAPCFLRDEDRKSLFITHLAAGAVSLLTILFACFVENSINVTQLRWLMLYFVPLVLPAAGLAIIMKREQAKSAAFTSHYYTKSKSD